MRLSELLKANSKLSSSSIRSLTNERCRITADLALEYAECCCRQENLPQIDISIVTFNNGQWTDRFIDSLIASDYPRKLMTVYFVDNASTDSTVEKLAAAVYRLKSNGINATIINRDNHGFGAGHNFAIKQGKSQFCLVTNIDLIFEKDAIKKIVCKAMLDDNRAAAWELRQKPYEHPKYYDPVTHATNWNSHACVLLRREAFQQVGGYDENIFMYGEDVDISYRLRNMGYILRYCPSAVVWHYTYDKSVQLKPLQDKWSRITNLYLRVKFGTFWDIVTIPILMVAWFFRPPRYTGARYQAVVGIVQFFRMLPKAIAWRHKRRRDVFFDFSFFDYGLTRYGAFYEFNEKAIKTPLVSVLTRTFPGRELYLQQALLSVRNQTYKNIEHIIVEDGGSTYADLVKRFNLTSEYHIRYSSLEKVGRSKTGNEALSQATGEYCLFLDDDDLLYSDHIEVLVDRALQYPEAGGSYSLAFEVATDTRKILVDGAYCEKSYILLSKYQQDFDPNLLLKKNYFPIQSVLFKRSLFMEHGGLDERLEALEDWNLWIRYSRKNKFVYAAKLTSLYRVPSNLRIAATRILKLQEIREIAVGYALNSSQHDNAQ